MSGPFESGPAARTGLGALLLGRRSRAATLRDVEALLADAPRITDVTRDQVRDVAVRHGVDLDRLQAPLRDLYRRYLEFCLEDRAISEDEVTDLAHLRGVLHLGEETAAAIHEEVAYTVYGSAVDEVLSDNRLEPDEEGFLQRLRNDLGLDTDAANRALEEGRARARRRYLSTAVSPDDLFVVSRDLTVKLEGSSAESVEDAVNDALKRVEAVMPGVERVEITRIEAEIDPGRVRTWHVQLEGAVRRED
jgi:flavin-binding protein dodecin